MMMITILAIHLTFFANHDPTNTSIVSKLIDEFHDNGRSLDERMNARREPRPGAGASGGGEKSFADQVLAASKKAGRR